jgi:hypothetical protein
MELIEWKITEIIKWGYYVHISPSELYIAIDSIDLEAKLQSTIFGKKKWEKDFMNFDNQIISTIV